MTEKVVSRYFFYSQRKAKSRQKKGYCLFIAYGKRGRTAQKIRPGDARADRLIILNSVRDPAQVCKIHLLIMP